MNTETIIEPIIPAIATTIQLCKPVGLIVDAAWEAGRAAAQDMPDHGACGFAWVTFREFDHPEGGEAEINGRSKLGRALLAHDRITTDHLGRCQLWAGTMYGGQSIDAIEHAAHEARKVFELHGFKCHVGSRLD